MVPQGSWAPPEEGIPNGGMPQEQDTQGLQGDPSEVSSEGPLAQGFYEGTPPRGLEVPEVNRIREESPQRNSPILSSHVSGAGYPGSGPWGFNIGAMGKGNSNHNYNHIQNC